jgi:RHH-type transcriptional regulator, rel operon repressor / antitoxin RelB
MTISIRLEPELEERINNLATQTNRSKSFYIREMILQAIEDMEDYYLAEKTMEDIRKGASKLYTSDEIRKEVYD